MCITLFSYSFLCIDFKNVRRLFVRCIQFQLEDKMRWLYDRMHLISIRWMFCDQVYLFFIDKLKIIYILRCSVTVSVIWAYLNIECVSIGNVNYTVYTVYGFATVVWLVFNHYSHFCRYAFLIILSVNIASGKTSNVFKRRQNIFSFFFISFSVHCLYFACASIKQNKR